MTEPSRLLLLDDCMDLDRMNEWKKDSYSGIICLFWIAPSTKLALSNVLGGSCYGLMDIVGSDDTLGESAHKLATQIIQGGPSYGELRWRTYLTERIYRELHTPGLLMMVVTFIEKLREQWGVSSITIEGVLDEDTTSFLVGAISDYPCLRYRRSGVSLKRLSRSKHRNPVFRRLRERIGEICLTGDWRNQLVDAVEWADKTYRMRTYLGRWPRHPKIPKGGITFFSSYLNNSRVLSSFMKLMPRPVNWLCANGSAYRGVPRGKTDYSWVWQFSRSEPFSQKVTDEGLQCKNEKGRRECDLIKTWVTNNPTWNSWTSVELSLVVTLTQCWEAYLEEVEPRLIVMANQWGIEGWFTQIAKKRKIPVLQIMHGVLGGYLYTGTHIISDLMVVPGEFWRNLWEGGQRQKILVCNPVNSLPVNKKGVTSQKRVATFFSWPLSLLPFYSQSELTDGFIHIFHRLVSKGMCEIIFRAHPQENPSDFVQRWSHLYGAFPSEVHVSKNEPLSQVLSKTDVALMFRSTVMLDCMANDVPIVMPGWIDFGWNEALVNIPSVCLAHDFVDLENQLVAWLENPPRVAADVVEYFVRSPGTGEASFSSSVRELIGIS